MSVHVFFFNDTATTEIYTLSLHDAPPILHLAPGRQARGGSASHQSRRRTDVGTRGAGGRGNGGSRGRRPPADRARLPRSEEHTSEFQSRQYLVCRLLLEKKKRKKTM